MVQQVLPLAADVGHAHWAQSSRPETLGPGPVRVGVDENGLGARLGPLVVTAVAAQVNESGERVFRGKLRGALATDLGDSKSLVSHTNVTLGEAWARVLTESTGGPAATAPSELLARLSHYSLSFLQSPCSESVRPQCWAEGHECFEAPVALLDRLRGHLRRLERRGVTVISVRSAVVCSQRLNRGLAAGRNRFTIDLNTMEDLLLALGQTLGSELLAVCGKVGGMREYGRFFGPFAERPYAVIEQRPECSRYRVEGLGEVRFVQDADAKDPLVMLASLVGKYLREIFMARVQRFYSRSALAEEAQAPSPRVSGYHDARTSRWVQSIAAQRRQLGVGDICFERAKSS